MRFARIANCDGHNYQGAVTFCYGIARHFTLSSHDGDCLGNDD